MSSPLGLRDTFLGAVAVHGFIWSQLQFDIFELHGQSTAAIFTDWSDHNRSSR